jgi:RHS repeat-associated protein
MREALDITGAIHVLRRHGGLIENLTTNNYYFQDASGSTSHLADANGNLLEWYRYDLDGTPVFYDANNNQLSASNYSVRHLFTGQQWYSELGLYDLRNRFYSPDIGRFLQSDPIDFDGDPTNLYRYSGNNPIIYGDPSGLWTFQIGVAINFQAGWLSVSWNRGIAFDGSGNIVGFNTIFGGAGAGARWSGGVTFAASNADTVFGLARDYKVINGGGGAGASGTGQVFWGRDAVNRKFVGGVGTTIGVGLGGGGSGGGSWTTITPLWTGSASNDSLPPPPPAPDDITAWDVNGNPMEVVNPRGVTVTGEVPPNVSGGRAGGYYYGGYGGYFPGPGGTYGGYAGYGVYGSVGGYTFDPGTHIGGVVPGGWSPFWPSFYNAGGAAGSAELTLEGGWKPKDL